MKVFDIYTIFFTVLTVSALLFHSNPQDSWEIADFREYLSDNDVYFLPDSKLEELKKLSRKQWSKQYKDVVKPTPWYHPQNLKQQILKSYDDAAKKVEEDWYHFSYSDVKEWVFSTWSSTDLRALLDHANVKYNAKATHTQLVQLAKDNYDTIAKSNKASGKYPGGWLYSGWTEKSLKKWLDEYDVAYTSSDTKEQLARKVRQYAYDAAQYSEDQRQSIIESLDLSDKSIFDKAGDIKDDIFATWTASQLYNWLTSHKVEVSPSAKTNQKELTALAKTYKGDLKTDVDNWVKKISKKASPVLSKSTSKADNVVNDTFFVGVEKWSRDRLKAFLTSRGISIPTFATRHHLIKLVKENKFTPIKTFNNNDFFEGWSKENLLKWAGYGDSTDTSAMADVSEKAGEHYKTFVSNLGFYANQVANKVSEVASDAASQVSEKGAEAYGYAAQKGAEAYAGAAKHGAKAYGEGSKHAGKAYREASKQGAKAAIEAQKQGAKAAAEASKKGSEAYAEGIKQSAKAAAGASKMGADIYAQAAKKSAEAKDSFFNYWSDVELKTYLKSFGIYDTKGYSRDDLLNSVKKNTRWFVSGSKYDTPTSGYSLSGVKYYTATFWNTVTYHLKNVYNYVYYTIV